MPPAGLETRGSCRADPRKRSRPSTSVRRPPSAAGGILSFSVIDNLLPSFSSRYRFYDFRRSIIANVRQPLPGDVRRPHSPASTSATIPPVFRNLRLKVRHYARSRTSFAMATSRDQHVIYFISTSMMINHYQTIIT